MNKPAPKEPSMDEILSSIRQIIAEDDAGTPAKSGSFDAAPEPSMTAETPPDLDMEPEVKPVAAEPLVLSEAQIVEDDDEAAGAEPEALAEAFEADLAADPDADVEVPAAAELAATVADDNDDDDPMAAAIAEMATAQVQEVDQTKDAADDDAIKPPVGFADANLVETDDISFDDDEPELEPRPEPAPRPDPVRPPPRPAAKAPPLPDPTLSGDIAERLLEPTTGAAVRNTMSRLGQLGLGTPGVTIEHMLREMLRPMLKEWLDENLPTVVERMVEKEIARVSRGEE